MKTTVLIVIGLAFFGIEGMAQRGQDRGRGQDQNRKGDRRDQHDSWDQNRNRGGQYDTRDHNRGRGYQDRGRDQRSQWDHRGRGTHKGGQVIIRSGRPYSYSVSNHRRPDRVIVTRSPGIYYSRYVYSPRVYVDLSYNASRMVLRSGEVHGIVRSMEYARFDDEALQVAKASLRRRGIRSADLAYLMEQLAFDDHRLELAKFAWNRTVDKRNFHIVFNKLRFRSNQHELDRYINGR